jgi:restriction system protein
MDNFISKHGGYEDLKSYQMAEIVYDYNAEFCKLYVPSLKQSDQMEGAARGGKQNIAEGSQTSGSSKQSELRLVQVARASQEELLIDYKDFLRKNGLPLWDKDDERSKVIRKLAYEPNRSYRTYMTYMQNPEAAANCAICLIKQTTYLLDRQWHALEKELMEKGDYHDRYKQARKTQILGNRDDYDDFLKELGFKRLENGRVVSLESNEER